jgi:hypothetical protein
VDPAVGADPADEYMHSPSDDPAFNGLYLPDGRVGFPYGRPEIADNGALCGTGAGGRTTHISEGLTEYRWGGRTGHGLSKYPDRIEDGTPVGE